MKFIAVIILIASLISCDSHLQREALQSNEHLESTVDISLEGHNQNQEDVFCDISKFPDYRENLKSISREIEYTEFQDSKAKEFIERACAKDSLFCGEISKLLSKSYKFDNEWTLDLVGYVLDQKTGMKENSASFFILTINRNGKVWFTDILSDLMGEIQMTLNGFEDKERQIRLWGHLYPYFESDYGKFELTVKNGTGFYDYECHAEH